jgi:hypothetical protein
MSSTSPTAHEQQTDDDTMNVSINTGHQGNEEVLRAELERLSLATELCATENDVNWLWEDFLSLRLLVVSLHHVLSWD